MATKKNDRKKYVGVWISQRSYLQLCKDAEANGRKVPDEMRWRLRQAVAAT